MSPRSRVAGPRRPFSPKRHVPAGRSHPGLSALTEHLGSVRYADPKPSTVPKRGQKLAVAFQRPPRVDRRQVGDASIGVKPDRVALRASADRPALIVVRSREIEHVPDRLIRAGQAEVGCGDVDRGDCHVKAAMTGREHSHRATNAGRSSCRTATEEASTGTSSAARCEPSASVKPPAAGSSSGGSSPPESLCEFTQPVARPTASRPENEQLRGALTLGLQAGHHVAVLGADRRSLQRHPPVRAAS